MLTNEERRALPYTRDDAPTRPAAVTAATPLEELRLDWRESDLPEHERTKHVHRLHPYLGKFIPQLAEVFLRKYFQPGQVVLDPFCGSGTTLVQANELTMTAIGCDISAFNVLLCRVKTARYDMVKVRRDVLDVLAKVQKPMHPNQNSLWGDATFLPAPVGDHNVYMNAWFAPQARAELLAYAHYIETGEYMYKDVLRVILSRSARSARLTTHFDLDFPKKPQNTPYQCYKHSRQCYPTENALQFLKRYSLDTLERLAAFAQLRTDAPVTVHHADSRFMTYPKIDGVITSPPYVGLINYHEQHAYAYNLLSLDDKRDMEIGAAAGGVSQRAQRLYQDGIVQALHQSLAALAPGGRMIIIAADKANLYPAIAERLGVQVEAVLQRHVNRRTGRRGSEFYESIFVWRKA